jgi:predicted transcriptional regulator YdeE
MIRLTSPDQTHELLAALREAVSNAPALYGVTLYPADWIKNGAFYLAAVELPASETLAPTFVRYSLPGGMYVAFSHTSAPATLPLTRDYAYQTWLPRSAQSAESHFDLEIYQPGQLCQFALKLD